MAASDYIFGFDIYLSAAISQTTAAECLAAIYPGREFIYWNFIDETPDQYHGKSAGQSFFYITAIEDIAEPQYPFKLALDGLENSVEKWQKAHALCKNIAHVYQLDCFMECGISSQKKPYDCFVFTKSGKIYLGDDVHWEQHGRIVLIKELNSYFLDL